MILVKLQYSDSEISDFFRSNGFSIAPYMRGRWVPKYHNDQEWIETEVPGLLVDGKIIDAEPVFRAYAEDVKTAMLWNLHHIDKKQVKDILTAIVNDVLTKLQ